MYLLSFVQLQPVLKVNHVYQFDFKTMIIFMFVEVQLKPKSVELQRTLNRQAHRTSQYEIPNLILRRGQSFDIIITFDRSFNEADDDIVLRFVTG